MFKTLNGQTPRYLEEMFEERSCRYSLRNTNGKLYVPKPNTDYLKRSLSYSGAHRWNNLPESMRLSTNVTSFKNQLKSFF